MAKYHHLSPEERAFIMLERDQGISLRQIAIKLNRSPATLSRELKRNSPAVRYCATRAGAAYRRRRLRGNEDIFGKVLVTWKNEHIRIIEQNSGANVRQIIGVRRTKFTPA